MPKYWLAATIDSVRIDTLTLTTSNKYETETTSISKFFAMPPPSQLAIATSSVRRLLKEEKSYRTELVQQQEKTKVLEDKINKGEVTHEDGNDDFMLKQQKQAIEQTKAVFEPLRQRIDDAVAKLESQIELREKSGAPEAELEQAKAALLEAQQAKTESSS
jgi:tubulin-specific chaperone A